jgi:hypothetical protein
MCEEAGLMTAQTETTTREQIRALPSIPAGSRTSSPA